LYYLISIPVLGSFQEWSSEVRGYYFFNVCTKLANVSEAELKSMCQPARDALTTVNPWNDMCIMDMAKKCLASVCHGKVLDSVLFLFAVFRLGKSLVHVSTKCNSFLAG
jgi:hypothetical protein